MELLKSGVVTIGNENTQAAEHPGKGLKVPFDLLIELAAVEFDLKVNGGIVLIGHQTALIPTNVDKNHVQFHLTVNEKELVNPYTLSYRNTSTPDDMAFF